MQSIAIVGLAPSRERAPCADKDTQIWTIGDGVLYLPRTDAVFEMHTPEAVRSAGGLVGCNGWRKERYGEYVDWLSANKEIPVWAQERFGQWPMSLAYPSELIERFNGYFTSTVCYMLALAIDHKPRQISLYGVECRGQLDYTKLRYAIEFYCGVAVGRGINLVIDKDSLLLRADGLYGFEGTQKAA